MLRSLVLHIYDIGYNHVSWAYDTVSLLGSGGLWYEWVAVAQRSVGDGPVLEVGCGRGRLLAQLAREGHTAVGLDRSQAMVRAARRQARGADERASVVQGDALTLPLDDATIGTLITTFPAPYVGLYATQAEFARVLRPGGRWVWVDAPFARTPTLRMAPLAVISYVARINGSLRTGFGLQPRQPLWRPLIHATLPFQVSVEQVAVGPTAVHVALVERLASG
ncbi:MAG: class I SAM-dependent methyltransferase [Chloroflexaceae bacterium]|nr:class I SAM-dependent methyltransferase [Chloroflexaceae bacterium]